MVQEPEPVPPTAEALTPTEIQDINSQDPGNFLGHMSSPCHENHIKSRNRCGSEREAVVHRLQVPNCYSVLLVPITNLPLKSTQKYTVINYLSSDTFCHFIQRNLTLFEYSNRPLSDSLDNYANSQK